MKQIIKARDLGIRFHRNRRRHMSLREIFLKGKSTTPKGEFWAVRNASFDVHAGEAVGLVGANGQGKSTLLKLIAGVLLPDEGSVTVRGKVAPMIELTGGFVGDLSARQNIYLVGGVHGLSKSQLDERLDEVVTFADVHDFLDTPFRHFSSGMKVRLGFALMTTLDAPTILVDEVLAVGDKAFRETCYTRMEEMLGQGKTFFLVSHSERDLKRFCTRGLYMRRGNIVSDGPLDEIIDEYNRDSKDGKAR